MCGYPQFSFWISIALVKIYVSYVIINRGKNTFELVGAVFKSMKLDPPPILQAKQLHLPPMVLKFS